MRAGGRVARPQGGPVFFGVSSLTAAKAQVKHGEWVSGEGEKTLSTFAESRFKALGASDASFPV